MRKLSTTLSPWAAIPVLSLAVVGLAACSPPGQDSSNVKGTTPAIMPAPAHGAQPGSSTAPNTEAPGAAVVHTTLKDASGNDVGSVTVTDEGSFVKIEVQAQGLKPGFHGLHFHHQPQCESSSVAPAGGAAGTFLSAGGHWNIADPAAHPHSGDLTSLQVRKDGSAELVTTTDAFTLDQLKADGGHALIIHADADNFGNIPSRYSPAADDTTMATGDAGGRIACGIVK